MRCGGVKFVLEDSYARALFSLAPASGTPQTYRNCCGYRV
jgi:hypothetical protein